MNEILSIHGRRRRAPFHFLAMADNARFAASLLSRAAKDDHRHHASKVQYGVAPSVALDEAFQREAAVALLSLCHKFILFVSLSPVPSLVYFHAARVVSASQTE